MVHVGSGREALGLGCWVRASGGIGAWGPLHGGQQGFRPSSQTSQGPRVLLEVRLTGVWEDEGFH